MYVETRPWGRFIILYSDNDTWLKRLIISPGQSLSLQTHKNRDEYWYTTDPGVRAHLAGYEVEIWPRTVYTATRNTVHSLINSSDKEVHVLEWAIGHPTESDIVRLKDNYGRS